jgi:hypothetical protein
MRSPRGTCPTAANLTHYFSKLQKLGLVTKERQCAPEIAEILSRIAVAEGTFAAFAEVIRKEAPVSYYYGKWTTRCWRAMREMRIGIYTQDFDLINDALDFLGSQCKELFAAMPPTVQIITTPFDPVWLRSLPPSFQFFLLNQTLRFAQSALLSFPEVLQYLQDKDNFQHLDSDERLPFQRLLFNQLLLQGELDAAEQLITEQPESFIGTGAVGSLSFLRGNYAQARRFFCDDLDALQQLSGNDKVAFFGPPGLFHLLACLQKDSSDQNQSVAHRIGITLSLFAGTAEEKAYHFLAALINAQNQNKLSEEDFSLGQDQKADSLTILFAGLCGYWLNSILTPETEKRVKALYQQARAQHYHFFALNLADILAKTSADNSAYLADMEDIRSQTGQASIVSILEPEEP